MSYECEIVRPDDPRAKAGSNRYLKRFPPVLQLITDIDPIVANKLNELVWRSHRAGQDLTQTCAALTSAAQQLGYRVKIGVQEVYVASMPSYPGETIMTALLVMDARPSIVQSKGQDRPGTDRWRETG
jgi:hypothetical protein